MAQSGFTPIKLYASGTAAAQPLAANLSLGELALNYADGKLYYKDGAGAVLSISGGVSTITFGSTGLTPSSATGGAVTVAGTLVSGNGGTGFSTYATGDLIYASGVNTLAKRSAGSNGFVLTIAGGVPTWAAVSGGATPIVENENTISVNRTITVGSNGESVGPMTVNTGVTLTVGANQRYVVL